jgi:hypothetical protein
MKQYYKFKNRNIHSVPLPITNMNLNNYITLVSPMSILPNNIQCMYVLLQNHIDIKNPSVLYINFIYFNQQY